MTLLALSGAAVEFGQTVLFRDVTFTAAAGQRWGIVGRNGSGKTTLLRLLHGEQEPTRGTVFRAPGLRIAVLDQHRTYPGATTVWEAAAGAYEGLLSLERSLEAQAQSLHEASEAQLHRYGDDLERFEREGGYTFRARVDAVLQGLGFDADAARTQLLSHLSGGERGRVGLARQLAAPADILFLDEPTNHLDLETTRWLERHLVDSGSSALLISHDRDFLETVSTHILHIEANTAYAYAGSYSSFIAQRDEQRLTQVRAFEKQQKVISKEQDYIARNIAGQNSRQAKGRRTRLARMPRLSAPPEAGDVMALRLDLDERGGDQVLVADHVTISVGGRQLVRDFSGRIRRGDVVGLIGPNGAGKSSLIRAIVGEATPAAGELRLGASVQPGYYRQDLMQIPATETLYDVIAGLRPMWERGRIQHHLGRFGFSGDAVTRRAGTLSGGEQARLALAMLMLSRSNLLIFDEPTNHLDVETIEALEDAISAYEGSVLLVSHDRALLRALVTKVWGLADGRITEFDGSFDEWEELETERRAKVAAADADARLRERERAAQQASRHASATDAARARDRETRRAVERLESAISETESRIEQLTAQLADTSLYATEDGIAKARELDRALAADRAELERLVAEWERAMADLDGAGTPTG